MKFTAIMLLAACLQVSAKGRAQSITLTANNAPLKKVFRLIEKQAGITFYYHEELMKSAKKVNITLKDASLSETLHTCFANQPFIYEVIGTTVVVKKREQVPPKEIITDPPALEIDVHGRVVNENNEGLPDVSVVIKGTGNGTTTDGNGSFRIAVPDERSVLIFSSVGYVPQEIAVGNKNNLVVRLVLSEDKLNDVVVVVGYGLQSRRKVTGAVSTVNVDAIRDLPVSSIDQKLSGQVAGVQVNQVTGTPGGGSVIRVRGSGSIGAGDDPLYVIDGFPITNTYNKFVSPLSTINPDDIESINILKDAASTAIYGSRGSNGVILITTKKAKKGQSSVEFGSYFGYQTIPDRMYPKMMTAHQFAQWRVEAREDMAAFLGQPFDPSTVPVEYQNPGSLGAGTNWFKEITRDAPMHNHNITISKGTENLRTSFSFGYFNQEGTILNSNFERYSLRLNTEANLGKKIIVGVNLAPTFTRRKVAITEGNFNGNAVADALLASPLPPLRLADGTYNPIIVTTDVLENPNVVNRLENTKNGYSQQRILSNVYLNFEVIKDLNFRTSFNVDVQNEKQDMFTPSFVGTFSFPPPRIPVGFLGTRLLVNWLNENTLTYDKSWSEHTISILAGYTIQNERADFNGVDGFGYADDIVQTINASTITTTTANVEKWTLLSYLGRINYSYKNKYLFGASIRKDGSSRFGRNNQYGTFPSASIGWRITDENFFPKTKFIDQIKLRASHGLSGNNNIGNYTYIPAVVADNYAFNDGLAAGVRLGSLANENLGWESSRQTNIGADISMFNNRIFFIAEYYTRITEDMLQTIDIPAASGFLSAITNLGKVSNKGWEFTLNTRNITGNFNWETDLFLSLNKNKVLDIGSRPQLISGAVSANLTVVGRPMGMLYGYKLIGIFQDQHDLDSYPHQPDAVPGTVKYEDVNKDGVFDVNDRTVIGNPYPKFLYGINNRFSFKNFDLSIQINGSQGAEILELYKRSTTNLDGVFNVEVEVMDRWRSASNPGSGNLPTTATKTALARDVNSLWVKKASYLNVRNISLGYNFKAKSIDNVRVYASVQNALLISPYKGGFPEVNFNGNNSLAPGINYFPYPVPSTVMLGVNLKL